MINERKPFTPGEILKEEFMQPYGLTQEQLADLLKITRRRVNEIVNDKRAITPDTASRLGKLFKMSPQYWLNLQNNVDLWIAINKNKNELKQIKPIDREAA